MRLSGVGADLGQRGVRVEGLAGVRVEAEVRVHQEPVGGQVLVDLRFLGLRLGLGGAGDEGQAEEERDVVPLAAGGLGQVAGLADELFGGVPVRGEDELGLGVPGGEGTACRRRPGLEQHRGPLRRRCRQVRALHVVALAVVVDAVHLVGVGVAADGVLQHGAVLPRALPELRADLEVLLGPDVALVVLLEPVGAEVPGGAVEGARDDVPADAAPGDVVERGDLAGEVERVRLDDTRGEREPEVLGRHGERGEQHGGVVGGDLQSLAQVGRVVAATGTVGPDDVGEEHRVELAALEGPRQVGPQRHVVEVRLPGVGVPPQAVLDVRGRVHDEGREAQRAVRCIAHVSHRGRRAPPDDSDVTSRYARCSPRPWTRPCS